MPRTRKKKGTDGTDADVTQEQGGGVAVAEMPAESSVQTESTSGVPKASPPNVEEPPFIPTGYYTPTAEQSDGENSEKPASRGQFRSWVVDKDRGYTRMVDEDHQRLVIQFEQRPPADVITAVKGARFHFQPDYCGQKNVWVRQNDFEGRVQVEAIEKLFKDLVPGKESPDR